MNSEMLSRRALAQFAAVALLFVLGFSALALLVADSGEAGASTVSAVAPVSAARPAPSAESRNPYGEMNLAWTEPGMIGVVGWAKDPDVNRPIDVVVAIDNGGGLHVRTAGVYNPFLPGSYGEKFRSYLVAIPVTPGPHTMCVAALNVGKGSAFRLLGCSSFVVPSANPVGSFEAATLRSTGDALAVSGWAFDPETTFPLPIDLSIDGAPAGRAIAALDRPDVAAAFPGNGSMHGFSGDVPVTPGRHQVCAVARNVQRGSDALLGCRTVDVPRTNPVGNVEAAASTAAGIEVSGWAGDPDAGGPISVSISDRVIGSIDDAHVVSAVASDGRPDVAAATGLDARAGFRQLLPVLTPGPHEICVNAFNAGVGRDQNLGCRRVDVPDLRPFGNSEATTPMASGVRVQGWALNGTAAATTVRIAVDGVVTTVVTDRSRPDVAAAFPGAYPSSGFDATISGLGAGRHAVCITFVGVVSGATPLSGDRALPCGSVIVGSTAVGTTGIAGIPIPIGPTGPLSDVDRDAGVTTTLRDGSLLWLFGDSLAFNPDGSMRYFVSGTGAWASPSNPTVTRDAVTPTNQPYLLATPGAEFPACGPSLPHRAMWPLSAVTEPVGGRDRVIVFLANMCLADATHFEAKGIAVAEWYYDPASPPVDRPVQLNVVNPNLGLPRAYGTAAVIGEQGYLYMYQCDRPANPIDVANFGPCRVARVAPVDVADVSQYRYWNGSSWSVTDPNVPISMPPGSLLGYRYPASAFTVVFDSAHGVYVMVYSPWPGFVDRAMVRVARTAQEPWSEPVEVNFPGCNNSVGGQTKSCYAGTAQPAFSTTSELGLGYYDQAIPADRNRGQYMVVRVPFVVTLS
jgi:hypothetical protein